MKKRKRREKKREKNLKLKPEIKKKQVVS